MGVFVLYFVGEYLVFEYVYFLFVVFSLYWVCANLLFGKVCLVFRSKYCVFGGMYIVFGIANWYFGVNIWYFRVCIWNLGQCFFSSGFCILECTLVSWGVYSVFLSLYMEFRAVFFCVQGCVFWSVSLVFLGCIWYLGE